MGDLKVGGYGPDGCTCALHVGGCPVHDGERDISAWQPIATAPKDGTPVLLLLSGARTPRLLRYGGMTIGYWHVPARRTAAPCWVGQSGYVGKVTHWMPLPDPPRAGTVEPVAP